MVILLFSWCFFFLMMVGPFLVVVIFSLVCSNEHFYVFQSVKF